MYYRCNDTSIRIGIGSFWEAIQYIDTGSVYCDTVDNVNKSNTPIILLSLKRLLYAYFATVL